MIQDDVNIVDYNGKSPNKNNISYLLTSNYWDIIIVS
jgi:hypothetical protein